jgi:putative endonuclease
MKGFVYIMTNNNKTVLYTGVTSDLKERVTQHKVKKHPDSFSARYNICKLVYFESFNTIGEAIIREKQIKGGSRKDKVELIIGMNPEWADLSQVEEGIDRLLRPPTSFSQ